MTVFLFLTAMIISSAGLYYLWYTNERRRRALKLPPIDWPTYGRNKKIALSMVFVPGVFLLFFGTAASILMWLGALPLFGWALSAINFQAIGMGRRSTTNELQTPVSPRLESVQE